MENTYQTNQPENPFLENNNPPKRSTVLTVFLVLSFIGGGFYFFSYLLWGFLYDNIKTMLEDGNLMKSLLFMEDALNTMLSAGKGYYFFLSFLSLVSFVGAILMWQMKKIGFFVYSGAQIILLILPLIVLGSAGLSLGDILFTALFVGFYASNIKNFH